MSVNIETANLEIRDVCHSDYRYFAEWESDPEVTRFFSFDAGRTYKDVVTEGYEFRDGDGNLDLTITEKESGEPLGRIMITRIDGHSRSLDVTKIYVGGDRRGQGIGSEALLGLLKYLFEERGLQRVTLDYYTGNRAAGLYRKMGFVDEGVARKSTCKDGEFHDLNLMSILRDEYFAIYGGQE